MSEAKKKREKKLAYAKSYYMANRDALIKYARNKCDYKKKRVALEDDNPNEIVPSVPIAPPPTGTPKPPPKNMLPKKPFKIEKPKGKEGNKWIEALKIYNKGKKWSVPKKGSAEYVEVKKIMDGMSFTPYDMFKKR
jgi:hypothetical protein